MRLVTFDIQKLEKIIFKKFKDTKLKEILDMDMENLNKSHLRKYLIFYVKGTNNRLQVLVNFKNVKCVPNILLENKCKTGESIATPAKHT